jgi:hypothetical protein
MTKGHLFIHSRIIHPKLQCNVSGMEEVKSTELDSVAQIYRITDC